MTYLSCLMERQYSQLLGHLSDMYIQNIEQMQSLHYLYIRSSLALLDQVSRNEQTLLEDQHKLLNETVQRHDKEINDRQTIAMKMSYFKDYDRQVRDLENENRILKRRLESTEKKTKSSIELKTHTEKVDLKTKSDIDENVAVKAENTVECKAVAANSKALKTEGGSSSEAPNPVKKTEKLEDTVGCKAVAAKSKALETEGGSPSEAPEPVKETERSSHSMTLEPIKSEDVKQTEPIVNSEEQSKNIAEHSSVLQRRRIKWKGEIYYYDPSNLNVYLSENSKEIIGKKEEKRLVMSKAV